MKKIYICHTLYHVYITLAKEIKNKNCCILLSDSIPKYKDIGEKIINFNIMKNVYYIEEKKIQLPGRRNLLKRIFLFKSIKESVEKYLNLDLKIYDEVIIYNDYSKMGYYINACNIRYTLNEDALDLYQEYNRDISMPFKYNIKDKILEFFKLKILCVGESKYINKIEVNKIDGIRIPKNNVIEVPRKEIIDKLSDDEKEIISRIFMDDNSLYKNINNNRKKILILTEPLYADNRVKNIDSQIKIYTNIIKQFVDKNEEIYIKPHPRDNIDYQAICEKYKIISKNIPLEVLNFNDDIRFDKVITISSTSIDGIENSLEKVKLGIKYIEKI